MDDNDIALRANSRGCEWTAKQNGRAPYYVCCPKICNQNWHLEFWPAGVTSFHEVGDIVQLVANAGSGEGDGDGFSPFVGSNPGA